MEAAPNDPRHPTPKPQPTTKRREAPPVRTIHDNVDPCSDEICCCEPEPRWREIAGEDEPQARLKVRDA